MSLELGSRFRLPEGRLVEVVPDTEKILGFTLTEGCSRCCAKALAARHCIKIGCIIINTGAGIIITLLEGYPRILKEVENEQTEG